MNDRKFKRIGKELAYIVSKFEQMYLSPNCCYNGDNRPTDEDLGKLLIESGSRIMVCPKCGKKYIVTRKGNEKEFHKVEIMEYIEPSDIPKTKSPEVAASSCKSFEEMSDMLDVENSKEKFKGHFLDGFGERVSHLFNAAIKYPKILTGRN